MPGSEFVAEYAFRAAAPYAIRNAGRYTQRAIRMVSKKPMLWKVQRNLLQPKFRLLNRTIPIAAAVSGELFQKNFEEFTRLPKEIFHDRFSLHHENWIVLVIGNAGIGKSSLVNKLLRRPVAPIDFCENTTVGANMYPTYISNEFHADNEGAMYPQWGSKGFIVDTEGWVSCEGNNLFAKVQKEMQKHGAMDYKRPEVILLTICGSSAQMRIADTTENWSHIIRAYRELLANGEKSAPYIIPVVTHIDAVDGKNLKKIDRHIMQKMGKAFDNEGIEYHSDIQFIDAKDYTIDDDNTKGLRQLIEKKCTEKLNCKIAQTELLRVVFNDYVKAIKSTLKNQPALEVEFRCFMAFVKTMGEIGGWSLTEEAIANTFRMQPDWGLIPNLATLFLKEDKH